MTESHLSAAIEAIRKDDGVSVTWPGNNHPVNFVLMYEEGSCKQYADDLPRTQTEKISQQRTENEAPEVLGTRARKEVRKEKHEILHEYDDLVQNELKDAIKKVLFEREAGGSVFELNLLFDQVILAKYVMTGLETRLAAKGTVAIFVWEEFARASNGAEDKPVAQRDREKEDKLCQLATHYSPIMDRLTESGRFDKFMRNLNSRL